MRLYEKLRAQITIDYTYTWASVGYTKLLVRDDLPTLAQVTVATALTVGDGSYATTTLYWILTRKYAYTTVLDGIARGSLQIRVIDGHNTDTWMYAYAVVSLVTIDSAAAETTLGTVTTGTWSKHGSSYDVTFDLPFWIDLQNKSIAYNQRLLLKVAYYIKNVNGAILKTVTAETALNFDDTFVEIPIVPGVDM